MRRLVLGITLMLLSVVASSAAVAPSPVHAQTYTVNPMVSVSPSTVPVGSTAIVSGTGFTPNCWVFVYWQRPDISTNGIWVFSSTTGTLSFTLGFNPAHGAGTEYIAGYDSSANRWSPFSAITVTSGTTSGARALAASVNPIAAGATTTVTGTGFSPNNVVYVQWTRPNGSAGHTFVYTDAAGMFSFPLGFLASNGCGTEAVVAFDYGTNQWSTPYGITVTGC